MPNSEEDKDSPPEMKFRLTAFPGLEKLKPNMKWTAKTGKIASEADGTLLVDSEHIVRANFEPSSHEEYPRGRHTLGQKVDEVQEVKMAEAEVTRAEVRVPLDVEVKEKKRRKEEDLAEMVVEFPLSKRWPM